MKKAYLNPETQIAAMMPQSIICGSLTYGGTTTQAAGGDTGGGQELPPLTGN